MDDATVEFEKLGPSAGVSQLLRIDHHLQQTWRASAESRDRRLDEPIPVGRGDRAHGPLENQNRDTQMLGRRWRGIRKGCSNVDRLPQDKIRRLIPNPNVQHAGVIVPELVYDRVPLPATPQTASRTGCAGGPGRIRLA